MLQIYVKVIFLYIIKMTGLLWVLGVGVPYELIIWRTTGLRTPLLLIALFFQTDNDSTLKKWLAVSSPAIAAAASADTTNFELLAQVWILRVENQSKGTFEKFIYITGQLFNAKMKFPCTKQDYSKPDLWEMRTVRFLVLSITGTLRFYHRHANRNDTCFFLKITLFIAELDKTSICLVTHSRKGSEYCLRQL